MVQDLDNVGHIRQSQIVGADVENRHGLDDHDRPAFCIERNPGFSPKLHEPDRITVRDQSRNGTEGTNEPLPIGTVQLLFHDPQRRGAGDLAGRRRLAPPRGVGDRSFGRNFRRIHPAVVGRPTTHHHGQGSVGDSDKMTKIHFPAPLRLLALKKFLFFKEPSLI